MAKQLYQKEKTVDQVIPNKTLIVTRFEELQIEIRRNAKIDIYRINKVCKIVKLQNGADERVCILFFLSFFFFFWADNSFQGNDCTSSMQKLGFFGGTKF